MSDNVYDFDVFLDCGAPSLYNSLSRKLGHSGIMGARLKDRKHDDFSYTETDEYKEYLKNYIRFLLEKEPELLAYSNLDVINNTKLTLRNQKRMEAKGLEPIPVYHLGSSEDAIEGYMAEHDYLAIGGLVPNRTKDLIPALDRLFKKWFLDKDGFPKIKLHGFACTAPVLITRYPWYSVDSATCRKLAMYGKIYTLEHGGKWKEPITAFVSSRDVQLKDRYTPLYVKQLEKQIEAAGYSTEEMQEDCMVRMVFNYLYFLNLIQEEVPRWPWSQYTRESRKGANEFLHFYVAGSLSKKEERYFWKEVARRDIPAALKKRMLSFFYLAQVKYVLSLAE